MSEDHLGSGSAPTRRRLLGGIAGVTAGVTSGCLQRARTLANRQTAEQISLSIKTVPADVDEMSTTIARTLATNLETVGVEADLNLLSSDELRREVLINHDFDIYVGRYPGGHDPDFLRSLLHSVFDGEPGWQNPFGFTADIEFDELIDEQRYLEGERRREVIFDIQRQIAQRQPFSVVAYPDELTAVRSDRVDDWRGFGPNDPLKYLTLRPADRSDADDDQATEPTQLRIALTNKQLTRNFNPIAIEFRVPDPFIELLYDPLARRYDGSVLPWLAGDWSWTRNDAGTTATLRLRENLTWHDGRPITAGDVAFTYRFLADTTLREEEMPVPAPRFRGRVSLVDAVESVDTRTVEFRFGQTSPEVAVRAFTVPLFPQHEWEPKAQTVDIAGLELFEEITEALVWSNPDPVGSGPIRFEDSIADEAVFFEPFEGHFLQDEPIEGIPFEGGPHFEEFAVRVAPSDSAAVELVAADEADLTGGGVSPSTVPQIARHDALHLTAERSRSFYHVGYNTRRSPLGNPHFRRAIAQLLDKEYLATDAFGGYAAPASTPLDGTPWVPRDLRWEGTDPEVPFAGTNGSLDVERARDAFRETGYRYDEENRLVSR